MIKSVGQSPVYELLSAENNVVYEVPAYQREYSWGKDQWDALFDDILEDQGGSGHFLGTIICVNKTADTTKRSVLELVDGQQRMTTLSLLLLAIYKQLSAVQDQLNEDQRIDLKILKRMLVLNNQNFQRISLQKQNNNFDDYIYVLADAGFEFERPKTSFVGLRRIAKALKHFQSRLDDYSSSADEFYGSDVPAKLFSFFERVKKSVLVKLEVANHTDAFVLFESLNNRGLPLTPIDLIKTQVLSTADKDPEIGVDKAYKAWSSWLENLGDDYSNQERFFRHFYNAFKTDWALAQANAPVATRTKLIQIYENLIKQDLNGFMQKMTRASNAYGRILGNVISDEPLPKLDKSLRDVPRAQGVPAQMLLLFLVVNSERFNLSEDQLKQIVQLVIKFSVRRNLTNTPPTYDLDRIFINIVDSISTQLPSGDDLVALVRSALATISASDEEFLLQLQGEIYDDNAGATRYILVAMAEAGMTVENERDLWKQKSVGNAKLQYLWTIEHILPQGENLPNEWVEMLGGKDEAVRIQTEFAHTIGNLTITAFNSTLGNKSFLEKRDRTDDKGNFIGYRNGLSLNEDLKDRETWGEEAILARTEKLSQKALKLFSF